MGAYIWLSNFSNSMLKQTYRLLLMSNGHTFNFLTSVCSDKYLYPMKEMHISSPPFSATEGCGHIFFYKASMACCITVRGVVRTSMNFNLINNIQRYN